MYNAALLCLSNTAWSLTRCHVFDLGSCGEGAMCVCVGVFVTATVHGRFTRVGTESFMPVQVG
jgi:hypothetical protein